MKIRIAVAVGSNGSWSATGWNEADSNTLSDCSLENIDETDEVHVVWVNADVPIPQRREDIEVDGEVEGDF